MKFLRAKWEHLLMANYVVAPDVLRPFVPKGTSIDEFESKTFLSVVGFMFNDTRVCGLRVPYHVNFEEVNLRFYIVPDNEPTKRAVTFIKELVPARVRFGVPLIANALFYENYTSVPMTHEHSAEYHAYSWTERVTNSISCRLTRPLAIPRIGSICEFITEHYWAYTKADHKTLEYRVEHPQWKVCELDDFDISIDFSDTYGDQFAFLNGQTPFNVLYADGSEVTVSFPTRHRTVFE